MEKSWFDGWIIEFSIFFIMFFYHFALTPSFFHNIQPPWFDWNIWIGTGELSSLITESIIQCTSSIFNIVSSLPIGARSFTLPFPPHKPILLMLYPDAESLRCRPNTLIMTPSQNPENLRVNFGQPEPQIANTLWNWQIIRRSWVLNSLPMSCYFPTGFHTNVDLLIRTPFRYYAHAWYGVNLNKTATQAKRYNLYDLSILIKYNDMRIRIKGKLGQAN